MAVGLYEPISSDRRLAIIVGGTAALLSSRKQSFLRLGVFFRIFSKGDFNYEENHDD